MSIPVSREYGARFNAPPHLAGKRVKCPKCLAAISIPTVSELPLKTHLHQLEIASKRDRLLR